MECTYDACFTEFITGRCYCKQYGVNELMCDDDDDDGWSL